MLAQAQERHARELEARGPRKPPLAEIVYGQVPNGYRANALIGQVNKWVADVRVDPEDIVIHFRDGSVISFSTRPADVGAYEAFALFTRAGALYEE